MNAPRFDLKQEVYLKCKVESIETRNGRWEYVLKTPSIIHPKVEWIEEKEIVEKP